MKSILIFLILVVVYNKTTLTFAQTYSIKAGLNLSTISGNLGEQTYNNNQKKVKFGPLLGATVALPISQIFSLETGLLISTKGYKVKYNHEDTLMHKTTNYKNTLALYYLDIPLTAKASFSLCGIKAHGAFGPYFGLGIYGNGKDETTRNGETETSVYKCYWGINTYNQVDMGLIAGIGVEINSFNFDLSYDFSLINIDGISKNDLITKNQVIGLSMSYIIRKK